MREETTEGYRMENVAHALRTLIAWSDELGRENQKRLFDILDGKDADIGCNQSSN